MTKADEYIRIVVDGYGDLVSRKYLSDHFFSAFKKKEQDSFIDANIFFDNCLRVVTELRENIEERYQRRKQELIDILAGTKAEFGTSNGEELNKKMKQRKYNVDSFDKSEVQVNWSNITEGNYSAPTLYMKDLSIIEESIKRAKSIVLNSGEEIISVQVMALIMFYLKSTRYINGSVDECIIETKRLFAIPGNKILYFRKIYYKISKGGNEDPLTPKNLIVVIRQLQKYPRAKEMAEKDINSFE